MPSLNKAIKQTTLIELLIIILCFYLIYPVSYTHLAEVANNILKELEVTGVPNYFGWQRFGKPRTNTHLVGEALVQNDLKEAVRRYIGNPTGEEHEENQKARQAYDDGNLEESLELMSKGMRYEKMMVRELIKDAKKGPLDDKAYKNALYALPKPLQRMFVHAYQLSLIHIFKRW